jgi:predicted ThiF/HesA family dinucleotide-utilizing enzyme
MIQILVNPNTKIPSVAILLRGYFGLGKDGVKLVDSDMVFEPKDTKVAGLLPITAFDTVKVRENITSEKQVKRGNPNWKVGVSANPNGRPKGTTKTPLADLLKEVAENKHYKIKDTGEYVRAYDIIAEKVVDRIVEKGDLKALEIFLERTEGKVTQGIKLSGALAHGSASDEEMNRLRLLFPNKQ